MSGGTPGNGARSLAGGALLGGIARVAVVISGALAIVLVARLLGPTGSGQFAVISSLLFTLSALSTLGIEFGASWLVANGRWSIAGALRGSAVAALVCGLIGAAIGMLLYALSTDSAFEGIDTQVALIAMAALPSALLITIFTQLAITRERYEAALAIALAQSAAYVVGVAALGAAFDLDGAVAGLLIGQVAGSIAALVWWGRHTERKVQSDDAARKRLGEALRFGVQLYAANAAAILIYRFDVFLLNAYSGSEEAGYYAVAIAATSALGVLPAALGSVLFPRLASFSDDPGEEEMRRDVQDRAIRHTMLIVVASSALLALALPLFTKPVFGPEFGPAIAPGLILIPGAAALGLATTLYSALAGRGHPDYAMKIALVTTPFAIGLYLLLVPPLEAVGAALGSSIAYGASAVLAALALRRVSGPAPQGWFQAVFPGRAELRDYRVLVRQIRRRELGGAGGA